MQVIISWTLCSPRHASAHSVQAWAHSAQACRQRARASRSRLRSRGWVASIRSAIVPWAMTGPFRCGHRSRYPRQPGSFPADSRQDVGTRTTAGGGRVRSRWIRAVVIGTVAGLVPAASASAQNRPYVNTAPTTTGSAIVGATLTSVGGQAGGPSGTTVGRAWLRCTNPTDERSCELIDGAWNTATYTPTGDDVGKRLRSALYAYKDYPRDLVWKLSPATAPVANAAPAPAPTATPTPPPVVTPPAPAPVQRVAQPLPTEQAPVPTTVVAAPTQAKRMKPFPVVRISGVLTMRGAQISRLTVRAPTGARITVKCSGTGCPKRRVVRSARRKAIHIPSFETYLRAGVKLSITISRPGYISKVTTIT